jgi:Ca2+-binding EF-hand superfamily protein
MFWKTDAEDAFRLAKYRDYFGCLDHNGDGCLRREDFDAFVDRLCNELGWSKGGRAHDALKRAHLDFFDGMCARMDEDDDGCISLSEFEGFFLTAARDQRVGVPRWALEHVRAMFAAMDLNKDGTVSPGEYGAYLRALGSNASPAMAFRNLDVDGNGVLDLDEVEALYVEWLRVGKPEARGNVLMTGRVPAA